MPPPLTQTMYLRFNTKQEAKNLSADFWVRILGHPKRPEDTTEFLFGSLGCKDGAHDYLVMYEPFFSQIWPLLSRQSQPLSKLKWWLYRMFQLRVVWLSFPHLSGPYKKTCNPPAENRSI